MRSGFLNARHAARKCYLIRAIADGGCARAYVLNSFIMLFFLFRVLRFYSIGVGGPIGKCIGFGTRWLVCYLF